MSVSAPKVSVIFPIYNNEKYLEKCIRSVMNQTLKDIELILIDDGSTDSAPAICDSLAAKDDRIKVIHKVNEGAAIGMNTGIENARGEYIAFVESDDSVDENMYEKLYARAKETDADIVKCGFYFFEDGISHEVKYFYDVAAEREVFTAREKPKIFLYHASIWASLYRREFLNENNLRCIATPSATYCDFSWMAMTYAHAKRITICHAPYYYYTYDNPSSSRVQQGEKTFYKLFHCQEASRILREAGIFNDVKEEIAYHEFRTCLGHAQLIRKDLREVYFNKFRELMLDTCKEGCNFTRFPGIDRLIINALLNGKMSRFYRVATLETVLRTMLASNGITNRLLWIIKPLRRGGKKQR